MSDIVKFCLDLSHHRWARADDPRGAAAGTLRAARIADEAGIDSLWLSEDPDGWDAFAVLSAVATQTERLRLGTGVTNPYLRHPNLIAMSLATLDRLSGGRAFLGLGRGQPEWYQHAMGMRIGSPLAALEETIDLLHQWWQPEHRASINGHFDIRGWHRAVSPIQPSIPIYLAALGPKALALAVRRADGLLIADFASLTYLQQLIPELRRHLERDGRDPNAFDIYLRANLRVTDDPEPVLEQFKNQIALVNSLPGMTRQMVVPGFDVEAIMARVRQVMHTDRLLERGGAFIDMRREGDLAAARRIIPTELVDKLALVGPPNELRQRLRAIASTGVTQVFVEPPKGDAAEFAATLGEIAIDE